MKHLIEEMKRSNTLNEMKIEDKKLFLEYLEKAELSENDYDIDMYVDQALDMKQDYDRKIEAKFDAQNLRGDWMNLPPARY